MRFNSFFLISHVFSFDRQAYHAVLAINTDDLNFDFFIHFQRVTGIFYLVTTDLGGLESTFNTFSQGNHRSLGIDFFNGTFNDTVLIVFSNIVIEGIIFQLLDTQ